MLYKKIKPAILPLTIGALMLGGLSPAQAYEESTDHNLTVRSESTQITPELLEQARQEMINAGISHQNFNDELGKYTQFTFDDGTVIALPILSFSTLSSIGNPARESSPLISGGRESGGFWIQLSPFEQNNAATYGTFALGAAICAIPGLGWAACVVVGLILTQTSLAISNNSCASKNRDLRISFNWGGTMRGARCA